MPSHTTCRIVVTGGPGSGKTEFLERLKAEQALAQFVFFDELARAILSETPSIRHDKTTMHREIYRRQVEREEAAGEMPFITDRGTVDAFAFHPETMADVGTTLEVEYGRYSAVVQLGSAAGLGERYYRQDRIRRETTAEALDIEEAIRKVWDRHPNYAFVPATIDMEEKYDRFRRLIVENIATCEIR